LTAICTTSSATSYGLAEVYISGRSQAVRERIRDVRLPNSKAEDWDGVTRVHLHRAVDGELRRAAQVGADGRLSDMGLSDGGQRGEQLGSGEHHGGEVYGGRVSGGEDGGEEEVAEAKAKVKASQCGGPVSSSILAHSVSHREGDMQIRELDGDLPRIPKLTTIHTYLAKILVII
jgi:hypothetical protein